MRIAPEQLQAAVDVLRARGARRVLLFGSFLDAPEQARDIDLAVEGVPLSRLLEADVAVQEILRAPADLVSREENPAFFDIVRDYAKVLYEEG